MMALLRQVVAQDPRAFPEPCVLREPHSRWVGWDDHGVSGACF